MAVKTDTNVQNLADTIVGKMEESAIKIGVDQLATILLGLGRSSTMGTIVSETEPDIKSPKTSGMGGRIKKRSYSNVVINFTYANSVNNQRVREDKEADFVAEPRKWGERIPGTPIVRHKDCLYLETKIEKVYQTQYYLDGVAVDKEAIKEYLREKPESSRQDLDKLVILRDYKLSSIVEIRIKGQVYIVG